METITNIGLDCPPRIFQAADQAEWTRCRKERQKRSTAILFAICVIVVILLIFFASTTVAVVGGVVALLIIGVMAFGWLSIDKTTAHEWNMFERSIKTLTDTGKSRADAIVELERQNIQREETAARYRGWNRRRRHPGGFNISFG